MKNSVEYILSFYGIMKAGGVVVPVSTHYGERELAISSGDRLRGYYRGGRPIITGVEPWGKRIGPPLRGVARRWRVFPEGRIPFSSLLTESKRVDRSVDKKDWIHRQFFRFPAGTTGLPKGVVLTHSNLLHNLYQVVQAHEVGPDDTLLNQLPFFHIYGMTVLMGAAILAGATQVVASRFRPVDEFFGSV